jgi:hypothetical protein
VTGDEYLQTQLQAILQPGEQVLHTAYMRRQPGILVQAFFFLIAFLLTKAYFAVLTNRRLIFIRTKMGAWTGVQNKNLGVEQYDVRALTKCTVGGIANNKSMTFQFSNGPAQTLRISPWFKSVQGTAAFHDQVPNLINSGQIQAMATGQLPPGGMGQLPPGAQMGQPQMGQPQMGQPQMGHPQMQQPMQQQPMMQQQPQMQAQQAPLQAGMQVMVSPGDGQRYPATILLVGQGQYQCQMPNGQPYWFNAQQVSVG